MKVYPSNYHHNYYSSDFGWEYLGSDDKHDYYVNHRMRYTSIVYGEEPWEYMSPWYPAVVETEGKPVNPRCPIARLEYFVEVAANAA